MEVSKSVQLQEQKKLELEIDIIENADIPVLQASTLERYYELDDTSTRISVVQVQQPQEIEVNSLERAPIEMHGKRSNSFFLRQHSLELAPNKENRSHPKRVMDLPTANKRKFQLRLFAALLLQLSFVAVLVALCTFQTRINKKLRQIFDQKWGYALVSAIASMVLLALLYAIRRYNPYNYFTLLLFSISQCLFAITTEGWIGKYSALFACGFTLVAVIMIMVLTSLTKYDNSHALVLRVHPLLAGFIAYAMTFAITFVGFYSKFRTIISSEKYWILVGLELIVVICFAYDLTQMYETLHEDEYINGAIYFYTDLIILMAMALCAVAFIALAAACEGLGTSTFDCNTRCDGDVCCSLDCCSDCNTGCDGDECSSLDCCFCFSYCVDWFNCIGMFAHCRLDCVCRDSCCGSVEPKHQVDQVAHDTRINEN